MWSICMSWNNLLSLPWIDPFVLIVQVQHLVGDLYNGGVLQGVEEGRQDPELEGERHQTISLNISPGRGGPWDD